MSGHSKWSQIKRQKGVADTKRGQLFTKLAREITVAARQGGGDPETNFRLRLAVQKARDHNMPLDNIDRAVKRGAGGGAEAEALSEVVYEGYGSGGIAIMLRVVTDNRNRTSSDVRNIFARSGGNLGETGCVSWLFESKGVITVEAADVDAEDLALQAIDVGAEDIKIEDNAVEIYTKPEDLEKVRKALESQKVKIASAEVPLVPKSLVAVDEKHAPQALRLLEKLEELDEVQHVFTNADFPNDVLEKIRSSQ